MHGGILAIRSGTLAGGKSGVSFPDVFQVECDFPLQWL